MTDADLEPAARRLCAIRGVDPDVIGFTRYEGLSCTVMWKSVLPELRAHLEREQALMDVLYERTNEYVKGEPE